MLTLLSPSVRKKNVESSSSPTSREALGCRERECRRGRGPQAGGTNDGPATQQGSGGSDCTSPVRYVHESLDRMCGSRLLHCAGMLRAVRLEMVRGFSEGHNAGLWTCLCNILNVVVDGDRQDVATPLFLGGLRLRDAVRTSPSSFLGQLGGDCIAMVWARHPDVAALILHAMRDPTDPPTLVLVQAVAHQLVVVEGFEPPSWEALTNGQRLPRREPEEFEPGGCRHGWQHEAASPVERQHRGWRSQSGPLAGVPLPTTPCNFLNRIDSHLSLLCPRVAAPPFTVPVWPSLDAFGHHRTSCGRAGVLGRRGFAVVRAGARICRETGGRVVTNAMLGDFDLAALNPADQRRVEILTYCPSSTPRWFLCCTVTVLHIPGRPMKMALCCRRLVSGRREHTPSLQEVVPLPVLAQTHSLNSNMEGGQTATSLWLSRRDQ